MASCIDAIVPDAISQFKDPLFYRYVEISLKLLDTCAVVVVMLFDLVILNEDWSS